MTTGIKKSKFQLFSDKICLTRFPGLSSAIKTSTIQVDLDHFFSIRNRDVTFRRNTDGATLIELTSCRKQTLI